MTNVDNVKTAIQKLTPLEYAELQQWLDQQNNVEQPIDHQLKVDLEAGMLDELLTQAIADHKFGMNTATWCRISPQRDTV